MLAGAVPSGAEPAAQMAAPAPIPMYAPAPTPMKAPAPVPAQPATAPSDASLSQAGLAAASLQALRSNVARLRQDLETARQRFAAGVIGPTEVRAAERQVEVAELELLNASRAMVLDLRRAGLWRPVEIDLKEASLEQAAKVLALAAGLPIRVHTTVPATIRLSVSVRGLPAGRVLEVIAQQADVAIAPVENEVGVELQPWPVLMINGARQVFKDPSAPWTAAWGGPPMVGSRMFNAYGAGDDVFGGFGGFVPRGIQQPRQHLPSGPVPPPAQRVQPGIPPPAAPPGDHGVEVARTLTGVVADTMTMTGLGDRTLVVAQPWSEGGQTGTLLTVYRLEGDNTLRRITTTFHRPVSPARRGGGGGAGQRRQERDREPSAVAPE